MMDRRFLVTAPDRRATTYRVKASGVFLVALLAVAVVSTGSCFGQVPDPLQLGLVPIGRPIPKFDLPPVKRRNIGLSDQDLKGEVSLVNVFASWCGACRDEHPLLMDLAGRNAVSIHGLNYKDLPENARRWLERHGDPYARTGADRNGRVSDGFGLFGVPQTFVVDHAGRIAYVHIGALRNTDLEETILPLVNRLRSRVPAPLHPENAALELDERGQGPRGPGGGTR